MLAFLRARAVCKVGLAAALCPFAGMFQNRTKNTLMAASIVGLQAQNNEKMHILEALPVGKPSGAHQKSLSLL